MYAGVGSGGRVQKVPESSGQNQPCDCFHHGDSIVHMGKTTAQKGANGVKEGIRHRDVYATAVGDITKAYFI